MENKEQPKHEYTLLSGERAVLQGINSNAVAVKAKLHDLQEALGKAQSELEGNQAAFNGAVTLLANLHGMSDAQLTAGYEKLVAPGMGA